MAQESGHDFSFRISHKFAIKVSARSEVSSEVLTGERSTSKLAYIVVDRI